LLARWFEEGGDRLTLFPVADGRLSFVSGVVLVPVLLSARILQEHIQHTQVNLFLLFMVLVAFDCFRTGRPRWGGLALAVAASVKAAPVLLVGYLLYRRRWRDVLWTVGWLLILNAVLPALVFGPSEALDQWGGWRAVAAREIADPASAHRLNQSLLAATARVGSDPETGRFLFYGVAGFLAAGLALAFRGGGTDLRTRRAAGEWTMSLVAMTLVTPLAWKAHYVTLLPGYWFLWWAPRPRWATGMLAVSALLVTASAPAVVGRRAAAVLESWNVIAVGALIVLALGVALLRRLPPLPPTSSATRSPL